MTTRAERNSTNPDLGVLAGRLLFAVQDEMFTALAAKGFDADTVARVVRMVDGAEYKRRQAPPGPKITGRSFGKDRRLPITNRFRGAKQPAR